MHHSSCCSLQMKTSSLLLLLCALLVTFSLSEGAGCNSKTPTYGDPNMYPILDATLPNTMTLEKTVPNGKSYRVNVPNGASIGPQSYFVTHVWGTPYEMGYAQGSLYNGTVSKFIDDVWFYLESQVEEALPGTLPDWLRKLISEVGLIAALDWTYEQTKNYTGSYIYEEFKGLSVGGNIDYQRLVRVHMLAGLTQGKCSMIGAWGSALSSSLPSNSLIQSRSLDWEMDGPFRDYSTITVYHPDPDGSNGHPFVNVGLMGFIGGLTGMSEAQLGISEIGVSYPDATFGEQSRVGIPFIFILRDILQFDYTIDDAINRMINSRRTCNLILGVGDGKMGIFRAFQYSHSVLRIQDDMNMMPFNSTWHPRIPNVVYYGMDWVCPAYNYVLSKQIQAHYGKITPEVAIRDITSIEKSGNNHAAFYDLTAQKLYVAFAGPRGSAGSAAAYDRQYTKFDVRSLFSESRP